MTALIDPVSEALEAIAAGSPADLARAVALLRASAAAGAPEAARHLAALAAAGVGMPQDFERALDWLAQAAQAGSTSAQGQLRTLAGQVPASHDSPDWNGMRRAVSIEAWGAPCQKRVLIAAPRTVAITAFLPRAACSWLIGLARARLAPALVFGRETITPKASGARRNSAFEFAFADCDVVTHLTRARIAATVGLPVLALESSQILHYRVGESFALHHDFLDPADPAHAAEIMARGQRIVTFLIYLNDDFESGETAFPRLDLAHRGAQSDALYFGNLDSVGAVDRRTLHSGLAPTRGEKWVFSQWIRNVARV